MLGRCRRGTTTLALASLAAAPALALLVPGTAAGAVGGATSLAPQLARLAAPAIAARSAPAQAAALGLPAEGPGSLAREGKRVIVEARFEAGALARLTALKAAGAKVRVASRRYQTVALSVEPADLKAIAAVPGIASVAPSRRPVLYGTEEGVSTATSASTGSCEGGSVISEGVPQLNVPAARAAFGALGAGVTVGVLSDSFDSATESIEGGPIAATAADDEASNDLPGPASTCAGQQVPVRVIAEAPPPAPGEEPLADEGRAMLQVVHDLAPQAELAFATAYGSELEFAENIERLAKPVSAGGAGADVIVDDVGYLAEPFFQDGPVAVAVRRVTEDGVTYLTAAGNDNLIEEGTGRDIGSWEAPAYRPIACPGELNRILGETSSSCMNFSPSGTDPTFGITVEPEGEALIDLQWAEPWFGVEDDLDAYLVDESGRVLTDWAHGEGDLDSIEEQVPVEVLGWANETNEPQTVQLVINRCSGACNPAAAAGTPRLKFAVLDDGAGVTATEYPESAGGDVVGPTIYGHAGAADAISLGAVYYRESATAPREPEPYSSRGPVTHYFGPVRSTTPAGELTSPQRIVKPNLTATDCASTTFFAELEAGAWHFCGTSEAAPHAAAVAALMKEIDPLATPAATVAAMESAATSYTRVTSPDAVGAGLLNADAAMEALVSAAPEPPPRPAPETEQPPPVVSLTKGPPPLGSDNRPLFEFTSTRPVAFSCQIDGGTPRPCASPYLAPSALADGAHGFTVSGTDAEGRAGSSGIYAFTVDTTAPRTRIVGHPRKVVRTRKRVVRVRFRLWSNESPVTFYCQFDREALRVCPLRFHHRFRPGRHSLKVRARDAAGNLATRRTVYRFRVKELRRRRHRARHAR